ncbi:MAG: electron transport complex subunit RsxC [Gammaproteobacteria bacterium]|nr:electron transport complex subunit RsxC [Gammaproteobacteria bacterium]
MKTILNLVDDGQLWQFHGGIKPPTRKKLTHKVSISELPLPQQLFLSLSQHIGQAAIPVVAAGDYVTKGQLLAKQDGFISAAIIAPTSGTISDIRLHNNTHASGIQASTIILTPDKLEQWREQQPLTLNDDKSVLLERIQLSGITGLGGASFPTAVKLAATAAIDFLIINGAECEPYITADDLLMQERSDSIVAGIEIMHKLLSPQRVIIAIEDNKPLAIAALKQAVKKVADRLTIIVRSIATIYPAGGEKQLIEMLTSKQVPSGKIPADIGIVMQNVATSYAVAQAVLADIPLLSRIVTVTGDLVNKPGNYEVLIGTPIETLLKHAEFKAQPQQKIIIGGPMMGFALHHIDAPVVKSTNCVIAASKHELPEPPPEQNCIRCGDCEQVCPANLLPQQLQWYAKDQDQAKLLDHDLFDCIECGACAFVCPSAIPLVQYYRVAKAEIRQTNEDKRQADRAKERFEQRNLRLERDKEERAQRSKKAAEARQQAMAKTSAGDAVAAALARVKAKKAAAQQTDAPSDSGKDRVAQAIARAKAKKAQQPGQQAVPTSDSPAPVTATNHSDAAPSTGNAQKDRVAAAIARAKAKKSQAQPEQSELASSGAAEEDPKKARVAAAIARAKAKKAAAQADTQPVETIEADLSVKSTNELESNVEPILEPSAEPAIDPQKARVAAAIARAKAKRAAAQADTQPVETAEADLSVTTSELESSVEPAVDPQKARVAAAIARAKAKRAAAQTEQQPKTLAPDLPAEPIGTTEQASAQNPAASDDKKARIAAVIAKAKAKKLAQQTDHNNNLDQT